MTKNKLIRIIAYARGCHRITNHRYDVYDYTYHLDMVHEFTQKFSHHIPEEMHDTISASAYCHDLIEDCRQTYNNIKDKAGEDVAEIVYALTNEKGKTRMERENEKYFDGIRNTPYAKFVKLCDRLANVKHSYETKSSMLNRYRKEHDYFTQQLYLQGEYEDMWELLRTYINE
jgi:(p)ppGpp synthase/HD superfamily hydrolase